jgi:hypothetical protein
MDSLDHYDEEEIVSTVLGHVHSECLRRNTAFAIKVAVREAQEKPVIVFRDRPQPESVSSERV